MKRVAKIASIVILNLVLLNSVIIAFNPLGLTLSGITYNNVNNYFSPDPFVNIILIFSVISLVVVNRYLSKNRTI